MQADQEAEDLERRNRRERRKAVRRAFGTKLLTTFAVLLTLVTLVVFALAGWVLNDTAYRVLEQQHGEHLEAVAALAAKQLNKPWTLHQAKKDPNPKTRAKFLERLNKICRELKERAQVSEVVLFQGKDRDYEVLASSRESGNHEGLLARLYADNLDIERAREEQNPVSSPLYPHKLPSGEWRNYKSAYTPIVDEKGRVIAMVGVEIPAQFTHDVERINSTFYLLGAAAGGIVLIAAVLLVRQRVHIPIFRLVKAMKGGEEGTPKPARVRYTDEIGMLTEHYNDMVDRLREKDAKLRELYAQAQERASYLKGYSDHLVVGVPSGVVAVDPGGTLTVWNAKATAILGQEPPLGEAAGEVLGAEHPLARALARALKKSVTDQAMVVLGPEGSGGAEEPQDPERQLLVELNCAPVFGEGSELLGAVALFTDRTELERFRKVAERNERLAAIGNLGAGLAHEIKNPLGAIQGFAELIERKEGAEATRLAGRLRGEVEELNHFLDEFLAFARANTIRRETTDVNALIDRSVEMALHGHGLDPTAIEGFRGDEPLTLPNGAVLHIRFDLDPDLPTLDLDGTLLKSAFTNLARNAIQSMPEGGSFTVRTHRVGGMVYVRFRDQGPGIPTEDREKIFNPLFTTRAEGTGMGLAIANKTVTAHGGKLSVRDVPGGGAEFVIRLEIPDTGAESEKG